MPVSKSDEEALDKLPRFDASAFDPPEWASGPEFQWGKKNGESSRRGGGGGERGTSRLLDDDDDDGGVPGEDVEGDEDEEGEEEEVFEDASEGRSMVDPEEATFTTSELKELLARATSLKEQGNKSFTSRPPDLPSAMTSYRSALELLPPVPPPPSETARGKLPETSVSGIEEVTDEQAEGIRLAAAAEEERARKAGEEEGEREREEVEEDVRECTKACWGNLGACHLLLKEDKEAAEACTKALEIDPHYIKALQRRGQANDRIGSWSSLTTAQEDYSLLQRLLPASSPHLPTVRHALATLPARIRSQQEKEKDEMLGKLKELGNGLLGKFGLSTDMFKFDEQPGGGYSMRFER